MSMQSSPQVRPAPAPTITEITERDPETGEPIVAHIVKTAPGESAVAKVTEARIYGYPVEALCGHVWVPSRDPGKYPMCQPCKEIYDCYRALNEDLGETPSS